MGAVVALLYAAPGDMMNDQREQIRLTTLSHGAG
jgi:hypothetical protein